VALGDVVWLTVAILGLAAVAQTFHLVFLAIKYAGAAYLLYLAWKLWSAPVVAHDVAPDTSDVKRVRLFLAGLAVTMGNPKVMVFYLALLPNIIDLQTVTVWGWLELTAVALAVLTVVFGSYVARSPPARAGSSPARAPCASSTAAPAW
jgi:threonine/homoserine/homoserine lactone efflux protein